MKYMSHSLKINPVTFKLIWLSTVLWPESEEEERVKALDLVLGLLQLLVCLTRLFLACLCFCIGERITLWGEGTSREKDEEGMGPTWGILTLSNMCHPPAMMNINTSSQASCLSRMMFLARADLWWGLFLVVSEESLARGTTGGWWNICEEILSFFLVQQLLVLTPTRGVSRCVIISAIDPLLPMSSRIQTKTEIVWYLTLFVGKLFLGTTNCYRDPINQLEKKLQVVKSLQKYWLQLYYFNWLQ